MNHLHTLLIWTPSGFEWIIVAGIALLLFGKRLPEVARSLGRGVVEFKKGLKGVEDDVENGSDQAPKRPPYTESGAGSERKDSSPAA
ncbi:MAG: twin-arginine translocase TatA/TatE family subunit [Planctomycetes bacterium]|nr:twin-arginine translocase TatA/TatE family subunit [Planctomycetota bacterium]